MPLTVGGGVRTLDDIRNLLKAGADKVAINSAAVKDPAFVEKAAKRFGSQCIVVAIDAKQAKSATDLPSIPSWADKHQYLLLDKKSTTLSWEVYIHGGRTATAINVVKWAQQMQAYGAGEILLTSMDRDGTKSGYDLNLNRSVSESVTIPVIASGGAGTLEHLYDGIMNGKADAVLAASIFHFKEFTIYDTKRYLKEKGICIRLT